MNKIPEGYSSWESYVESLLKQNGGKMLLKDIYSAYRKTEKYKQLKIEKHDDNPPFRNMIRKLFDGSNSKFHQEIIDGEKICFLK